MGKEVSKEWYNYATRMMPTTWIVPYWKLKRAKRVWNHLIHHVMAPVLDIGCGSGQFGAMLEDRGITDYVGVDFSELRIKIGHKLYPNLDLRLADAFESDIIDNGEYQTILLMEFLEHINDDFGIIRKIPPARKVIITVPNFDRHNHVRTFANASEVIDRYGNFLEIDQVGEGWFNRENAHFTLVGWRNTKPVYG